MSYWQCRRLKPISGTANPGSTNKETRLGLTLFGPGKIFRLMAQGGIDSTQQIQTLITPELQKIKNPFLLLEKHNFLTKSPNFLSLCLQP